MALVFILLLKSFRAESNEVNIWSMVFTRSRWIFESKPGLRLKGEDWQNYPVSP